MHASIVHDDAAERCRRPGRAADRLALTRDMYALASYLMRSSNVGTFNTIAELDLSFTQIKALCALDTDGEDRSVKALAESLGVSLPAMSRAVDGLYERGFVDREEDPVDRRMKRVRLTEAGRAVTELAQRGAPVALQELLRSLERRARPQALSRRARADPRAARGDRRLPTRSDREPRHEPSESARCRMTEDNRRWWALGGDVLRAVHDHARQHGRQRRAAVDPAQPARLDLVARVDGQRLHALVRRAARHRRAPRRPVRPAQDVPRRRVIFARLERRDRLLAQRHLARRSGARCRASARR